MGRTHAQLRFVDADGWRVQVFITDQPETYILAWNPTVFPPEWRTAALEADAAARRTYAGAESTTWSVIAIVSGSCSTTSTLLPLPLPRSRWPFMRWMSWGCRPVVGSWRT